jgi:hypothetical protein
MTCETFSFRRDENGFITNYHELPLQKWVEVPDSGFVSQIKPKLDEAGYTLYQYGSDKVAGTITNYNGMAWEPAGPFGYAHGGGHEGGSDNGIYSLDRRTMKWSVKAWPSRPGTDGFTEEDAALWGDGTRNSKNMRFPYSRSSTGFAVKNHSSFSDMGWQEAPPGPVGPKSVSAEEYEQSIASKPVLNGPGTTDWPADVMVDGRPTPRHVYNGLYTDGNYLMMASRAFWKAKLDGTGWVKYQDGGRTPFTRTTGEVIWSFFDEKTGRLWQGGCGSNCWIDSYFYYSAALTYNPVTNEVIEEGGLIPKGTQSIVNLGDKHMAVVKNKRTVYAVMGNGYATSFHLDGPERVLYAPPTTDAYSGSEGEGNAAWFVEGTDRLWLFDTKAPDLPAWEYDFSSTTPGEPFDPGYDQPLIPTLVPTAKRLTIEACGDKPMPTAAQGLVYNRMAPWEGTGLVVYVPVADGNVWVLRPM